MEVITQELNPTAEYTGYLSAPQSVEIKSRVGGVINSVSVPEGSYVRKGQVLFKIDPAPFQVALKTAQARLKEEVQYSQAVLDFNRANKLVESGAAALGFFCAFCVAQRHRHGGGSIGCRFVCLSRAAGAAAGGAKYARRRRASQQVLSHYKEAVL